MAPLAPPFRGSRLLYGSVALMLLGLAGVLVGTRVAASRTAYAYLTAYSFAVSVAVGALLLLLLGYAINAGWMSVIRRLTEVVVLALVPLALLFVPVALSARQLYVWTMPDAPMPRTLR